MIQKGDPMKRMLIKTALVLFVIYISGDLSFKYSIYTARTFHYCTVIDLLFRIVPGYLCGLILGYESILQLVERKPGKLDFRYILLSILLVGLVLYPYMYYVIPITMHVSVLQINRMLMSTTFSFMASLMAGYNLSQSFTGKK